MPEIGVAMATFYSVHEARTTRPSTHRPALEDAATTTSVSSVTGSTVFDFEGAGIPSVVYADECFLWVFDGPTGAVRLATPHTSFTATEASLVADIDGDGHAETAHGLERRRPLPPAAGTCDGREREPRDHQRRDVDAGPRAQQGATAASSLYGDSANSWVGTRTLWNEHTYHVTQHLRRHRQRVRRAQHVRIDPDARDENWTLPWLNDFRQNVQDVGIFNAPDAVVALAVDCTTRRWRTSR